MTSPDQIEDQIAETRARLSGDVDRLTEKVSPGAIASRRASAVKTSLSSARDRVMGSREDSSGLSGARDSVAGKASDLSDAAGNAPQALRRQTTGNPVAAGVIAFGVGWLLSSIAPASQAEQALAAKAEAGAKEHLADPVSQSTHEMVDNMKQPLQDAADGVKATAQDAAHDTVEHARGAADDVRAPLQH